MHCILSFTLFTYVLFNSFRSLIPYTFIVLSLLFVGIL